MNRREFLIRSAALVGAGLFLPWTRLAAQGTAPADSTPAAPLPDLVVSRGEPGRATHEALEALGGMGRFVASGQVVVVKPNASFEAPPEWGATTHPEVLAAVLEACFAAGARRVLVLDHTMVGADRCFDRTGTREAVARFPKASLVSLEKEAMYREVEVPRGKALHKTRIAAALEKADVLINVPKAKSHDSTGVSLGLKNLMGLVWDRHTFHDDMDRHQGIADLATVLRPHLTVLDAVCVLRTGGPRGPGDVGEVGTVLAGVDPVAVDALGVGLSTWNGRTLKPSMVAHLRHAAEHGLGTLDLDTLRIVERG